MASIIQLIPICLLRTIENRRAEGRGNGFDLMRGFIVSQYQAQFPEGIAELSKWLAEGKLKSSETVIEGFEKLPEAFIGLFSGKNTGKMIVKTT